MKCIDNSLTRGNKSEIVGWGIPDYTAGVAITSPYTATQPCFVAVNTTPANGTTTLDIKINSQQVAFFVNGNQNTQGYSGWFYLDIGDVIEYTSNRAFTVHSVFPLI